MLKLEALNRTGIWNWSFRITRIDYLYSGGEHDPMILADMDGYEMCNGRPFAGFVFLGPAQTCVSLVIIFDSHDRRLEFINNEMERELVL